MRVESPGYAAPCWADIDADGKKDLLVGQFTQGKIRVFKNLGAESWRRASGCRRKARWPKYRAFGDARALLHSLWISTATVSTTFFPAPTPAWSSHGGVISGVVWHGGRDVSSSRGVEGDRRRAADHSREMKQTITENICTRPFAVDWDADGQLDLVVGNFAGTFYWFKGKGRASSSPSPKRSRPAIHRCASRRTQRSVRHRLGRRRRPGFAQRIQQGRRAMGGEPRGPRAKCRS